MIAVISVLLAVGAILFTIVVREKDLPADAPISPYNHLEQRMATMGENLRDLEFEHRIDKLSDADYEQTKRELEQEMAALSEEIARLKQGAKNLAAPSAPPKFQVASVCPHCSARFPQPLKYCGECGKLMSGVEA